MPKTTAASLAFSAESSGDSPARLPTDPARRRADSLRRANPIALQPHPTSRPFCCPRIPIPLLSNESTSTSGMKLCLFWERMKQSPDTVRLRSPCLYQSSSPATPRPSCRQAAIPHPFGLPTDSTPWRLLWPSVLSGSRLPLHGHRNLRPRHLRHSLRRLSRLPRNPPSRTPLAKPQPRRLPHRRSPP